MTAAEEDEVNIFRVWLPDNSTPEKALDLLNALSAQQMPQACRLVCGLLLSAQSDRINKLHLLLRTDHPIDPASECVPPYLSVVYSDNTDQTLQHFKQRAEEADLDESMRQAGISLLLMSETVRQHFRSIMEYLTDLPNVAKKNQGKKK